MNKKYLGFTFDESLEKSSLIRIRNQDNTIPWFYKYYIESDKFKEIEKCDVTFLKASGGIEFDCKPNDFLLLIESENKRVSGRWILVKTIYLEPHVCVFKQIDKDV